MTHAAGEAEACQAELRPPPQQICTDSDGNDPHVPIYAHNERITALESTEYCNVEMELCDAERSKKQVFLPTDNIYALTDIAQSNKPG